MKPHHYFAILHCLGFTHKKLRDIPVSDVERVYHDLSFTMLLKLGFTEESAQKIVDKKTTIFVDNVLHILTDLQVSIVHIEDDNFPKLLKVLPDSPTILYVRGMLPDNDRLISVVGSRRHSQYALSSMEKILPTLIQQGYGIVSGGAIGIDSQAHGIALKQGGYTSAVFGAGIDVLYPPQHHQLFDNIVTSGGALISQFPLGTLAEPYNFPIRNAVVAGFSRGTFIVEAGEDSGTLITARLALEANRDVFVLPADISREGAKGSNQLIRDGLGKLILSAEDILSEYQTVDRQLSLLDEKPDFADPVQEKIYDILCRDSVDIDALSVALDVEMSQLMSALSLLEIEGLICQTGGLYSLK